MSTTFKTKALNEKLQKSLQDMMIILKKASDAVQENFDVLCGCGRPMDDNKKDWSIQSFNKARIFLDNWCATEFLANWDGTNEARISDTRLTNLKLTFDQVNVACATILAYELNMPELDEIEVQFATRILQTTRDIQFEVSKLTGE